jgi:hypothetical protein
VWGTFVTKEVFAADVGAVAPKNGAVKTAVGSGLMPGFMSPNASAVLPGTSTLSPSASTMSRSTLGPQGLNCYGTVESTPERRVYFADCLQDELLKKLEGTDLAYIIGGALLAALGAVSALLAWKNGIF